MSEHWPQAGLLMCVLCLGCWAAAQTVTPGPGTAVSAGPFSVPTLDNSRNPYLGATPAGQPTPAVIDLSLAGALDHALQYNLGLLLSEQGSAQVRAARARALSELLPQVNAHITESAQQTNLLRWGPRLLFLMASPPSWALSTFSTPGPP